MSVGIVLRHILTRRRLVEIAVAFGVLAAIALIAIFITPTPSSRDSLIYVQAQEGSYLRATVERIDRDNVDVTILDGDDKGSKKTLPYASFVSPTDIAPGSTILLRQGEAGTPSVFARWYIPFTLVLVAFFLAVIAIVGRRRGLMSVAGLGVSVLIIGVYIVPQLLNGGNAFLVITSGAFLIATASIYVAHGFSRRTTISVIAICIVLFVVACMSQFIVWLSGLSGAATEVAASLSMGSLNLDIRGILAGSIVIATLGVLDDVVTTQVAAIDKIRNAKPTQSVFELYRHGMDVGREHIAALVNTLALAYIGVSLPIVLLFASGQTYGSFLLFANSEFITQEIVRTIVSSLGLVIAIPISTVLAAWLIKKWHK